MGVRDRRATRAGRERAASLMFVLVVTGGLAVLAPSVLGLTFTGAAVTNRVAGQRQNLYATTSAIDAAVQYGRTARWVGRPGAGCPAVTTTVDTTTVTVSCTSSTRISDIDRTVRFVATVGGRTTAQVDVVYRDATAGTGLPTVDVVRWANLPADP